MTAHGTLPARLRMIATRLCDIEAWRRQAADLLGYAGDDISALEDAIDQLEDVVEEQGRRIARLEALLGEGLGRQARVEG